MNAYIVISETATDSEHNWVRIVGVYAEQVIAEAHAARINRERDLARAEHAALEAELKRLFAAEGLRQCGVQTPRKQELRAQALATCPQTAPAGSLGIIGARVETFEVK